MFVPTGGNEAAAFTQGLDTSGRRCFGARAQHWCVLSFIGLRRSKRGALSLLELPRRPKEAERRIRPSMSRSKRGALLVFGGEENF